MLHRYYKFCKGLELLCRLASCCSSNASEFYSAESHTSTSPHCDARCCGGTHCYTSPSPPCNTFSYIPASVPQSLPNTPAGFPYASANLHASLTTTVACASRARLAASCASFPQPAAASASNGNPAAAASTDIARAAAAAPCHRQGASLQQCQHNAQAGCVLWQLLPAVRSAPLHWHEAWRRAAVCGCRGPMNC